MDMEIINDGEQILVRDKTTIGSRTIDAPEGLYFAYVGSPFEGDKYVSAAEVEWAAKSGDPVKPLTALNAKYRTDNIILFEEFEDDEVPVTEDVERPPLFEVEATVEVKVLGVTLDKDELLQLATDITTTLAVLSA